MFLNIPKEFIVSAKPDTIIFTEAAMGSPNPELTSSAEVKDWIMSRAIKVRTLVLNFGHGEFTLRQYEKGNNVPLTA